LPGRLAVERARASAAGKQVGKEALARVGATLIPDGFGDITECRRLITSVGDGPILGVSAVFDELCATNGNVERSGGKAVHSSALSSRSKIGIVTTGRAVVTTRDDYGDALGGSLCPQIIEECILRVAKCGLALAEAHTQNRGDVVIDDVLSR